MINGINTGIAALQAISNLVSLTTKGRWDSWFKVNDSRRLIEKACADAIAKLQHEQMTSLMLANLSPGEHGYTDEKGRHWHAYVLEWKNEIDDKVFTTLIFGIDAAHAADQLDHIKQNGRITAPLVSLTKA